MGVFHPRVKAAEREVHHSLPSTAEVKNVWSYTSTPPVSFRGVHRENFTFLNVLTHIFIPKKFFQEPIAKHIKTHRL
jgi:hypothetical protein